MTRQLLYMWISGFITFGALYWATRKEWSRAVLYLIVAGIQVWFACQS
jgi:hypothetical protein